jgi:hypothetical protein
MSHQNETNTKEITKDNWKSHDKLKLAGEMLVTAAHDFKKAESDIDYIKCILLAGAVKNIAYPLIEEFGGKSRSREMAELATYLMKKQGDRMLKIDEEKQIGKFIAYESLIYNSLKHSGDKRKGIKPSTDLSFNADLTEEAKNIILDARAEFKRIYFHQTERNLFSDDLLDFLCSNWPN